MDNIHNKVAQLENAGVNASCQTFAMANAERFPQIVDRTKLLATYGPGRLIRFRRTRTAPRVVPDFVQLLHPTQHVPQHAQPDQRVLLAGALLWYQYSYRELLQYPRQVPAGGPDAAARVPPADPPRRQGLWQQCRRAPLLRNPCGRAIQHSRVPRPPGACLAHGVYCAQQLSRSYTNNINPVVCTLLVQPNITPRHATAVLIEQAATSLSVAQRNCFVLQYVNPQLHIYLFTITVQHINASLLSPVPRNSFRAFERCDFHPKTSVVDIIAQLENMGVTDPDMTDQARPVPLQRLRVQRTCRDHRDVHDALLRRDEGLQVPLLGAPRTTRSASTSRLTARRSSAPRTSRAGSSRRPHRPV